MPLSRRITLPLAQPDVSPVLARSMNARSPLPRWLRSALMGALLGASVHGWAHSASAEDSQASKLFEEGRTLVIAGRFAEACPKLEESQRLEPRLGTKLNVAFCQERLGKLASAWLAFQEAVITARREGEVAREEFAKSRIVTLEPRVPWLRVRADAGTDAEQLTILVDGSPLAPSSWGKELPVDPGEHALIAAQVGEEYWRTTVTLGESQHVDIRVPPPPPSAPSPASNAARSPVTHAAAAGATSQPAADASEVGRFVYEVGAFAGYIVVDTVPSEPEEDPGSIQAYFSDDDGVNQTLSCATASCDYGSLGATSGLVAGVAGYVGYTLAPRASLGARLLLGSRIEGGGLVAFGPSASLSLGERVHVGPTLFLGTASHAAAGFVLLETPTSSSTIDARLRGSIGFGVGLAAALDYTVYSNASGSVVLQATPLFLYGHSGMAYSLPLGAAYRWR